MRTPEEMVEQAQAAREGGNDRASFIELDDDVTADPDCGEGERSTVGDGEAPEVMEGVYDGRPYVIAIWSEVTDDWRLNLKAHKGKLLGDVPADYLVWMLRSNFPAAWHLAVHAALEQRGEVPPEVNVSRHAVERLSTRALEIYTLQRREDEGIFAFAERMVEEALASGRNLGPGNEPNTVRWSYFGVVWVVATDGPVPALLTCWSEDEERTGDG